MLTPSHLDIQREGLILDPAWVKNRKRSENFQPLPAWLVTRLAAWIKTGEARRLYAIHYERANAVNEYPKDPLFYVQQSTSRAIDRALSPDYS